MSKILIVSPEQFDLLITEAKKSGLKHWFNQKWVDISKKTKDGKHPPCGRRDNDGDGELDGAYPKCRPARVASSMDKKEKKNSVSRKRKAERNSTSSGTARKPNFTS